MPTVTARYMFIKTVIHQFRTSTTLGSSTLELWVHTVLEAQMFVFPCDGKDVQYLVPTAWHGNIPKDLYFFKFMICVMKVGYIYLHCSIKYKYIHFSYSKKCSIQNVLEPTDHHPSISRPHYINELPELPHSRWQLKTFLTLPTYQQRTLLSYPTHPSTTSNWTQRIRLLM
jgi:hypothetical protein